MRRCCTLVMCLALMLGVVLPWGVSTAYGAEPGSKRDDPVPMGTEARVGDYALTVLEVTPDADAIVAEANQFNDPPAEGRQFFIARVSITYVGADSGTPWANLSFRVVGNRNVGYSTGDDGCGVVPDGLSDTPELFEGGQIETNVCWSIETVDVDSLVMYAEQYFADGGRVWFSLDATAKPPMSGQKHQASATATPDSKASAGTVVEVETVDLVFQPRDLHIPADTDVTIVVTNKGVLQHDFVIEAEGIDSGVLDSGDSTKIVVNLPAGTYQFWCTVPGHKEAGMVGTLTVGGEGDTSPAGASTPGPMASSTAVTSVSLQTQDVVFEPKEITIPADRDVTLTVTNKGVLQHNLHIDGTDITSVLLSGGETDKIVVNLPAGRYQFWCTVPGHKEAGMVGTLIVE